jgi:hypothetical protein
VKCAAGTGMGDGRRQIGEKTMRSMRAVWKILDRWLWAVCLVLSVACATVGTRGGEGSHIGAGVGAMVGAGIGAVAGGDVQSAAAGAVVGGAVGYGVGWLAERYEVRRVRDEASLAEVYGAAHEDGPPQVHGYRSWIDPAAIRSGTEAGWVSCFDLQVPRDSAVRVVEERVFFDPDGNTISRRTYDYSHDITGSGGYEFELAMPVPPSAPEGKYGYQTRLIVGDQEAIHLAGGFQIARGERPAERVVSQAH